MKITTTQTIEIIGITSVVISLMFVAYQIQQTNQIAIVTTELETMNNFSSLNEALFGDSEFSSLLTRSMQPGYTPTENEVTRLRSWVFRMHNIWLAAGTAFENDMLSETTYESVLNDISFNIGINPYLRSFHREIISNYTALGETSIYQALQQELDKYEDEDT
jgi:hypothetical protein